VGVTAAFIAAQLAIVFATTVSTINASGHSGAPTALGLFIMGETLVAALLQAAFTNGLLVQGAVTAIEGGKPRFGSMWGAAIRKLATVAAILFLTGVAVYFCAFWFIAPGVMLAMAWAVAVPAAVMERIGPFKAFGRSLRLTRHNRWRLLAYSLAVLIANLVLAAALGAAMFFLLETFSGVTKQPVYAIAALIGVLVLYTSLPAALALVNATAQAAAYVELKAVTNLGGPTDMAAVFD
jgi:hypothetical protein